MYPAPYTVCASAESVQGRVVSCVAPPQPWFRAEATQRDFFTVLVNDAPLKPSMYFYTTPPLTVRSARLGTLSDYGPAMTQAWPSKTIAVLLDRRLEEYEQAALEK